LETEQHKIVPDVNCANVGKDVEGSGRGKVSKYYSGNSWRDREKLRKISVTTASLRAKI
jgi:hypothetical protein